MNRNVWHALRHERRVIREIHLPSFPDPRYALGCATRATNQSETASSSVLIGEKCLKIGTIGKLVANADRADDWKIAFCQRGNDNNYRPVSSYLFLTFIPESN